MHLASGAALGGHDMLAPPLPHDVFPFDSTSTFPGSEFNSDAGCGKTSESAFLVSCQMFFCLPTLPGERAPPQLLVLPAQGRPRRAWLIRVFRWHALEETEKKKSSHLDMEDFGRTEFHCCLDAVIELKSNAAKPVSDAASYVLFDFATWIVLITQWHFFFSDFFH